MRVSLVLIFAVLLYVPSFGQDDDLNVFSAGYPTVQYSTKIELFSGDRLIQESEVSFVGGHPASIISGRHTRRSLGGVPGTDMYESIGGLILAGRKGCGFSKPEYMSDWLWDGFWQNAQHLGIGELEFYVYAPGVDRIAIDVDRIEHSLQATRNNQEVDLEIVKERSFYGSLEMPYHCDEIGKPVFKCVFEGTRAGQIVMESQVVVGNNPDNTATIFTLAKAAEYKQMQRINSLVVVIPKANTAHPLEWHLGKINALENKTMPALASLELGQFDFHYFLPNADMLKISLWKIDGEVKEGWEELATFMGSKTVANDQPEPPAA